MSEGMMWVLIWCFAWPAFAGVRGYFRHRQRLAEMKLQATIAQGPTPPPGLAQDEELKMLRERVKVLERIVVDHRGADALSDEIEKLR